MTVIHRFAAWRTLCQRYWIIFRHSWHERTPLDAHLLREHEAAFLPAALSLELSPVSPTARRTAIVLIGVIVTLVLWSVFGHVDIIADAHGKIIPSARVKSIAAIEIAKVRRLNVIEGQHVQPGQVLVELDKSASDAERDKAAGDRCIAVLQAARAQALLNTLDHDAPLRLPSLSEMKTAGVDIDTSEWQLEQEHLSGQYRDYRARQIRIDATISHLRESLALATQRASDYLALLQDHDVAQHAWLEKEQIRNDLERELDDARQQRVSLLEETRRLAYDQLNEGNRLAASARQDSLRADAHSKMQVLTAPVSGTVQQLSLHTIGGVVPPAQQLMTIVPDEDLLEVEAVLENRDIGFVHQGHSAEVKVEAFDYTKYGAVPAIVTQVSRDAIKDEKDNLAYTVKVTLQKTFIEIDGQRVKLQPGMIVDVGIKTGKRRLIEYLLSPLLHQQREAMHER